MLGARLLPTGAPVPIYHSAHRSEATHSVDELVCFIRDFRTDVIPVLLATTAFGVGIDILNLRTVVHLGAPLTLIDYAQLYGRTSRDRQPSDEPSNTMIILHPHMALRPKQEKQPDLVEYLTLPQDQCRRRSLAQYLDSSIDRYTQSQASSHLGSASGRKEREEERWVIPLLASCLCCLIVWQEGYTNLGTIGR